MQGATSKMSHNRTVILVVRPLQGRSYEDDLPPQVKTCGYANETRWGLFSIRPCVNRYIVPVFYRFLPIRYRDLFPEMFSYDGQTA